MIQITVILVSTDRVAVHSDICEAAEELLESDYSPAPPSAKRQRTSAKDALMEYNASSSDSSGSDSPSSQTRSALEKQVSLYN